MRNGKYRLPGYRVLSAKERVQFTEEAHLQHYRSRKLFEATCRSELRFQNDGIARADKALRSRGCRDSSGCRCAPVENSGACLQLAKTALRQSRPSTNNAELMMFGWRIYEGSACASKRSHCTSSKDTTTPAGEPSIVSRKPLAERTAKTSGWNRAAHTGTRDGTE